MGVTVGALRGWVVLGVAVRLRGTGLRWMWLWGSVELGSVWCDPCGSVGLESFRYGCRALWGWTALCATSKLCEARQHEAELWGGVHGA